MDEATLCMDDYLALGVEAALDAINAIVPKQSPRCRPTAWAACCCRSPTPPWPATGKDRLYFDDAVYRTTDFYRAGQLALFIDDSQLTMLEAQCANRLPAGRADGGAFQLLNSYDMLWPRMVSEYLLGGGSAAR